MKTDELTNILVFEVLRGDYPDMTGHSLIEDLPLSPLARFLVPVERFRMCTAFDA